MEVAVWLRNLGLEHYEAVFRDNAIDADVLPELTDEHLKELGLPLGHRLKLLKAVAVLRQGPALPELCCTDQGSGHIGPSPARSH